MSRLPFALLVLIGTLFVFSSEPVSAVLIDDFTDSSFNSVNSVDLPGFDFSVTADAAPFGSILGGSRLSRLEYFFGFGITALETKTGTLISDDVMAYSADSGVFGAFILTYDADGVGLGGGLGEDLTLGGDNAFDVVINLADFSPMWVNVSIWDADSDFDFVSYNPIPVVTGGAPVSVPIPYSLFDSSIDFERISKLSFNFEPNAPGSHLEVLLLDTTYIPPVPEPSTLGLAGLGLLALGFSRRKRM